MSKVPINLIKPSPYQPRLTFEIEDLKAEIQKDGLLSDLVVRKRNGFYELIDGDRRLRALKELGWKQVPVQIREVDDKTARLTVYKLNMIRENYTVEERARYFKRLNDGGMKAYEIGKELNIDDNWVMAHLNVFRFPEKIQTAVWQGQLTVGHIQQLEPVIGANIKDATKAVEEIILRKLTVQETRTLLKPRAEALEKERIRAAEKAVGVITPTPVKLRKPEDFEAAAEALRREAIRRREEAMTPKERAAREAEEKRRREEAERRKREKEEQFEEEVKKRAKQLEEAEKRRIEEEARRKAKEEILSNPALMQEVVEEAREERVEQFAQMERRASEAAQSIAQPLGEALTKAQQDAEVAKTSKQRRQLENYMLLGSIIQSLKSGKIFCVDHEGEELMLVWSCGIPITKTHKKLGSKLGLDK